MEKYIVKVTVLNSNEKGEIETKNIECNFEESTSIESRNKAIEKAKSFISLFEIEMPDEQLFSSFEEALVNEFRNFNAYSIKIVLSDDYGEELQIYGDTELMIEALEIEADSYNENNDFQDLTEVEDANGNFVKVLESNIEFFLNKQQELHFDTNYLDKYIVIAHLYEYNIFGKRNSKKFEFIFQNCYSIEARNQAIQKVKELSDYFINGVSKENQYSSVLETQFNGIDFKYFTLDIVYRPEEGSEYQIFGEEKEMIYALSEEAFYYSLNNNHETFVNIEDEKGEMVEVLKSNHDFFLNSINN